MLFNVKYFIHIREENKFNDIEKNIYGNKNVDIKFSTYDSFLEQSLSGTLKVERLE